MELSDLEAFLDDPNPQLRRKAMTALRQYDPEQAVPLLKRHMYDEQFSLRSFVASGLGHKRNGEAFEALLTLISRETDHNVIAEAANSLSKFGPPALPHLVEIYEKNSNWLIRLSIFAVIGEFKSPETLLHFCTLGLQGEDLIVKRAALSNLKQLKEAPQRAEALEIACQAATDNHAFIRAAAAKALRYLGGAQAEAALGELRQDPDVSVVKAVLEGLL